MAQHDYVIDNQASASARADLNSLFQAIVSQNSGANAPATTYADMLWYETDTNTLWKRNEANSGWISIGVFDETNSKFEPNQTFATQAEAEAGTNNTKATTPLRVAQAIAALVPAGTKINYQAFTASGTWTKPAGLSADAIVIVEMWGAGGGGGRSSGSSASSGGGGGGAYLTRVLPASSVAATVSVGVSSGGAGATVNNTTGSAGGNSTFGSLLTAYGGNGGTGNSDRSNGGRGGGIDADGTWGGSGASDPASGNSTNALPGTFYGGGGGGAGSSAGAPAGGLFGGAGGGGEVAGATSVYGGNGGAGSAVGAGSNGSVRGGGGGGGRNANGGTGGRGEVRVWTIG